MLASDVLGVAMSDVTVLHGDTDLIPIGGGTYGSRGLQQGGAAVHQASGELLALARSLAGDVLAADPADIVVGDGALHVARTPAVPVSSAELAAHARERAVELDVSSRFVASNATYPFGAHVAVVEVDTETGAARLARLVACDDAGTILN